MPPLLLSLLESLGFKRNMHANMYLLDIIASAIPSCPPTKALDVNHRPHKPGNSRLRTQVWVFICYQHSGGHHMCYGTSADLPEQGAPFRLLSPCSLQPTAAASPGSSCPARISSVPSGAGRRSLSCLSWAGGLLPHVVSEPPTLYTELCALCGSPQR